MTALHAFMANLMLFLTLSTLVAAFAAFFAHKLKQRKKPTASAATSRRHEGPSLVRAYEPKPAKALPKAE